ncbi:MAG: septum formation protein Maf [Candidatus Omnitrophica bacterium]|nr:septum formation protein Maf [Candidatus Omnitrophota bacterium]
MKEIVLASASERRTRILDECGIRHRVVPSGAEEDSPEGMAAQDIVESNAVRKAAAVCEKEPEAIVIGADTLVVHGTDIIGKPSGAEAARNLLERFSGSVVEVCTGLCVIDHSNGRRASGTAVSDVTVLPLDREEGDRFFELMAPYDKAGGFTIEGVGSFLFDEIRGSYFNVLGLPMMRLRDLFADIGYEILDFVRK